MEIFLFQICEAYWYISSFWSKRPVWNIYYLYLLRFRCNWMLVHTFKASLVWTWIDSILIQIWFNSILNWILLHFSLIWAIISAKFLMNLQLHLIKNCNSSVANHTCRLFRADWFSKLRWSLAQPSQILSIATNEVIVACDEAANVEGQCAMVNGSCLCPASGTSTTRLHHVTSYRRASVRLRHIPGDWYPSISHVCHSKVSREGWHIWKQSVAMF